MDTNCFVVFRWKLSLLTAVQGGVESVVVNTVLFCTDILFVPVGFVVFMEFVYLMIDYFVLN